MTTETQSIDKSQASSSTNADSSRKLTGWYRLKESIIQSDPPPTKSFRSIPNSNLHNNLTSSKQQDLTGKSLFQTTNTNGHSLKSPEPSNIYSTLDSPPNIFHSPSIVSLASTPRLTTEDIPLLEVESTTRQSVDNVSLIEVESITTTEASSPASTDSRRSPTRSKKITIRKSTKSKEPSTQKCTEKPPPPITEDISDDDMLLIDIHKPKTKPIDTPSISSVHDTIIPLATDLLSLPGHSHDEIRDPRFLIYSDIDTLSTHLNTCLYIDTNSTEQHICQSRHNVLYKIFRIYYVKTFRKNLYMEKKSSAMKKDHKEQPLSVINSVTASSFITDWAVNRRSSSSTHRQTPKNFFHILQLNPKTEYSSSDTSSTTSKSFNHNQRFERIKDILARTYYPHLYTAMEYGYHFGSKSKFLTTQQLISTHDDITPIKEMPESPAFIDDSITITLKSPPSTIRQDPVILPQSPTTAKKRGRKPKKSQINDKSLSPISVERHASEELEEISPVMSKQSFVILTQITVPISSPASPDKEKELIINGKRKSSITINTNNKERKKKRIVSSPSPDFVNQIEDISDAESDENTLPSQLPKQYFIRNGLRSNYYKTTTDTNSKSTSIKTRLESRRRQSSGSLPPFYTGIFENDDDKSPYVDYCLPFDIYWYGQQQAEQTTVTTSSSPPPPPLSSSTSTYQHKKKKSDKPKQKQPLPYKKILRNVYTDQIRQNLLSSYNTETAPVCDCKSPETCEDGACFNKLIFTECLPTCACGVKCSNQKIRKNQWFKHLDVFDTGKYGQGLRTTATISKGTFLCEYVGEIITDEKFHERMTNIYSKDEHHYTMKLTQNLVIDAYRMGSVARFANHSCSPNSEFQKWTVDGLQRMCMFTLRTIKPGEEITYDYNFQCFNLQAQQPCYCESAKCRGAIGAKQQTITSSTPPTPNNNNNNSMALQRLTQREKRLVLQSSIFLLRNLRRIKDKQELRKKNNNNRLKQPTEKQSAISLFLPQNYYHSNGFNHKSALASLRKTPKIPHKDIFYLFYNHIRRSHFAKTGQYHHELIDDTCYYAQLAQLTLIFNEMLELLLNYKCLNEDISPSNALRKCPSKRLFPAYYEIITKPIDFAIIRNKLDNGEYLSIDLFEQDFLLLVQNVITYCGEDSDVARAVLELQDYFLNTLKIEYKDVFNLFIDMKKENENLTNLKTLEDFIGRLHEKEVLQGQIREILYDIIYNIDDDNENDDSPIVYKIVLANNTNSHRTSKSTTASDYIVHCRCGSVYDENSLVQCYACQLWQHVACVSVVDSSRPYYCFECQPACVHNPSACLKTNVIIAATLSPLQTYDDNHNSYSTLTRSDGFIVRINECYFVPKQQENNIDTSLTSPLYDILFIERLWIDDYGIGQGAGFYYIRPNETFHEPNRKFFPNEVFRFPSSNDPLPISSIVRPCFVLDIGTYCKGKPISDNSSRVLPSDLFICEYRVDKLARTFTRLSKSRQISINIKSYCFDTYIERLSNKREYQAHQKELQQQQLQYPDNRRRLTTNPNRLTIKQLEEKQTRINGIIEKVYCLFHDSALIPDDTTYTVNRRLHRTSSVLIDKNNHRKTSRLKGKKLSASPSISSPLQSPAGNINRKRHTISISSDDDIVELLPEIDCQKMNKKRSKHQLFVSPRKRDELIDQM